MRIALHGLYGAALVAGTLVACSRGSKSTADSAAGAVTPVDTTAAAAATMTPAPITGLKVAENDKLGRYVTDASGRALYSFTKDTRDTSTCVEKCADAWQPYTEPQAATASDTTLDRAKIGTIARADGKTQVTFDGKPLYYFKDDLGAGQLTGQSKKAFGGTWYLVAPGGDMIKSANGAMAKMDSAAHKTADHMKKP